MNAPGFRPTAAPETIARVFQVLVHRRRVSRTDLAEITGLTRTTIGTIVDHLIDLGIVSEAGVGKSQGGRPPIIIEFNHDAAYAIGAGMHDLHWDLVMTNLDAEVILREEVTIADTRPESAVEAAVVGYRRLAARVPSNAHLLPLVGLGSPGVVDMATGIVHSAVDLGWGTVDLGKEVGDRIGIPVVVANRSRVGALAEIWCAHLRGEVRELVYVTIGTGVAAGIVHDGVLVRGANSSAGELGHVVVAPDGPVCGCGNRGCLQTLVNENAILTRANALAAGAGIAEFGTAQEVIVAAREGIPPPRRRRHAHDDAVENGAEEDLFDTRGIAAERTVDEAGRYLATALGTVINLLNPEQIVLGGPLIDAGPALLEATHHHLAHRAMAYPMSAVTVRGSSFGRDSSAIGAAVMVIQRAPELLFRA